MKPSNGAALLDYQNYANLQKNLRSVKPLVDDTMGASYYTAKQSLFDCQESQMRSSKKELDRENMRIFGRLCSILDVSTLTIKRRRNRPGLVTTTNRAV